MSDDALFPTIDGLNDDVLPFLLIMQTLTDEFSVRDMGIRIDIAPRDGIASINYRRIDLDPQEMHIIVKNYINQELGRVYLNSPNVHEELMDLVLNRKPMTAYLLSKYDFDSDWDDDDAFDKRLEDYKKVGWVHYWSPDRIGVVIGAPTAADAHEWWNEQHASDAQGSLVSDDPSFWVKPELDFESEEAQDLVHGIAQVK